MPTMNNKNDGGDNYILITQKINKRFGDLQVLQNISLNVKRGEIIALIGPSGSGKSTLLRSLARLENIDSGAIYVDGACMVSTNEEGTAIYTTPAMLRHIRLKIGMVLQSFPLFPHMSVLQNLIEAPVSVLKMKKEQAISEAEALLKRVGLAEKVHAYPCTLSGGQKQRVAIARALAMKPEILLFDEPTSALDPELASSVLNVIQDLALQKNQTMIVVTHNIQFAAKIADRLILMEHGSMSSVHEKELIYSQQNVV